MMILKEVDKPKKKLCSEAMLWKTFSEYIRRRDANENGICKCFTCGLIRPWQQMDAGHGIPRQHKATKYNEKNNHPQCKRCNGFEGGMREEYKKKVDKIYGAGTWDKLLLQSKMTSKVGSFERGIMNEFYKAEIKKLKS